MRRNSQSVPDLTAFMKSGISPSAAVANQPESLRNVDSQSSSKSLTIETGENTEQSYNRSESLPTVTDDASQQKLDKPSERRRMHVMLEKRRRASMKERFDDLIKTVPLCNSRTRKVAILTKTVNYIKHLRQELDTITNDNYRLAETLRLRGVPTNSNPGNYGNPGTQPRSPYRGNALVSTSTDRYPPPNVSRGGHRALSPEPSLYNMNGSKLAFNFSMDNQSINAPSGHAQRPVPTSPSVHNQSYDSFSPGVFGNGMGNLNNMNVSLNSINEMGMAKLGGGPKGGLMPQQSLQSPNLYKGDLHRNLAGPGLIHSISVPDLQSMNKHRAQVSSNNFMEMNMNGNNAFPQQQQQQHSARANNTMSHMNSAHGDNTLAHMNSAPGNNSLTPMNSGQGDNSLAHMNSARGDNTLSHMNTMQSVINGDDRFSAQRQESFSSSQLPLNFGFSSDALFPGNTFNVMGTKGNLEAMDE